MAEVPPDERRTALLIEIPVEAPVDEFRQRHLAATVARGLPAHVTVLFPFAAATDVDARLRREVGEHFRAFAAFGAELTGVGQFDAHAWLVPEPHERFTALLAETYARFPQFPPYGDAFAEPVPHLTIAEDGAGESVEDIVGQADRELGAGLPFEFTVDRVALFEELADGTWRQSDSFELG
jgi:2'-5' RNA ligase